MAEFLTLLESKYESKKIRVSLPKAYQLKFSLGVKRTSANLRDVFNPYMERDLGDGYQMLSVHDNLKQHHSKEYIWK